MGIFKTAANRLSTFFAGAPKAEVDAANEALRKVAAEQGKRADTIIIDDVEPTAPAFKANRKQRRDYSHSFRQRTRNSAFGNRSKVLTPKQQHENAKNKWTQTYSNELLGKLLGRLPAFQVEGEVAA
ncbi:hypothetical protein VAC51_00026 [Variovorax phage VAC_51]|uniref:Uncharacterized protein n=1 Tax=Variovorax phage VAC_51 TaxID=2985242 RepID=A0A9N6ZF59_9CAUD|nr:hypothetical protein VAC51_00026 [Variovorax phage VAC_51]